MLESGVPGRTFFDQMYQTVMEGMFSDPVHGGNRGMAGWKMVGFPGVQANDAENIKNTTTAQPSGSNPSASHTVLGMYLTKLPPVDIVIVGFGWAGGIAAKELGLTGLKIAVLEKGGPRSTQDDFNLPQIRDELRRTRTASCPDLSYRRRADSYPWFRYRDRWLGAAVRTTTAVRNTFIGHNHYIYRHWNFECPLIEWRRYIRIG